jgi:outer membrane protein OmpA-like peptidoglycan-associated protein
MKKILLMLALFSAVIGANAQTATENAKFIDNTFVSVGTGVATPLAFDAVFPLNPTGTIAVGKWFTPVWGAEVEGTAWFGSHVFGGSGARVNANENGNFNAIRGTYVGVNGLVNLSNMFADYQGTPRKFELGLVSGLGWVHGFRPHKSDRYNNSLGAKTGLDFAFNLGSDRQHTISLRPSVLWNLSTPGTSKGTLAFNKHGAQLYFGVAYTYHFKTSNGTHNFKIYDVGAMNDEINRLRGATTKKVVEKVVEVEKLVTVVKDGKWVVQFAQGVSELTDEAKSILDTIGQDMVVDVVGTASPEGTDEFNQKISEERAKNVAEYLQNRGVRVNSWVGKGAGVATNRLAVITAVSGGR